MHERQQFAFLYPAMIIGVAGGATWVALQVFADFPEFLGLWEMIRLTTACAFTGGLLAAPLFGWDGHKGFALALIGGVLATTVGSMLAVGLVESPSAAPWGPLMVLAGLLRFPEVGTVWLALMLAAHAAALPTNPESCDCP